MVTLEHYLILSMIIFAIGAALFVAEGFQILLD